MTLRQNYNIVEIRDILISPEKLYIVAHKRSIGFK